MSNSRSFGRLGTVLTMDSRFTFCFGRICGVSPYIGGKSGIQPELWKAHPIQAIMMTGKDNHYRWLWQGRLGFSEA